MALSAEVEPCLLELQYDGSGFHGWCRQPSLTTVEGCLEEAFTALVGYAPALTVAGRTDAGVHARRQVVGVALPRNCDLMKLRSSLDALTPHGLAVLRLVPAREGFDARRDALSRCYRYYLDLGTVGSPFARRFAWHVPGVLDLKAMQEAALLAVGGHDFTAFTPTQTEHSHFRRDVYRCLWRRRGDIAWLEIEAQSFLRHMVRGLVGTLVEVGRGRRDAAWFASLLEGAPREAAGPTAPAKGLFLWDVRYPADSEEGGCP